MQFFQKIFILRSKIEYTCSNLYKYAILLILFILFFYFKPLIIIFIFFLIKYRKNINFKILLIILLLFILSYGISRLLFLISYQDGKYKVISSTKEINGYKIIIKKGIIKYFFYYKEHLNKGSIINIKAELIKYNKQKTLFGFNIKKYFLSNYIKCQIQIIDLKVVSFSKENILYRYINLFPNEVKNIYKIFFNIDKNINNSFIFSMKNLGLLRIFMLTGLSISFIKYLLNKILFIFSLEKIYQYLIKFIIFLLLIIIFDNSFILLKTLFYFFINIILEIIGLELNSEEKEFLNYIIITILFPLYIYKLSYKIIYLYTFISLKLKNKLKKYNLFSRDILLFYLFYFLMFPIILRYSNRFNLFLFLIGPFILMLFKYFLIPFLYISFLIYPLSFLLKYFLSLLSKFLNFLPFLSYSFQIPVMNYFIILLYYLFLYIFFKNKKILYAIFAIVVLILNIFKFYILPFSYIHFLDVGQGNFSLVIDGKNKKCVAVDLYGDTLRIIDALGIKNIDCLILTHSDKDHIEGYKYIKDYIKINNIYLSKHDNGYNVDKSKVVNFSYDKNYYYGHIQINFYKPKKIYKTKNDNSLVFKLKLFNKSILYTGDITKDVEFDLVKNYNQNLKADILMVPHHGSRSSSSINFINAVKPCIAIFSSGNTKKFNHPHRDIYNLYKDNNIKCYATRYNGSIFNICINKFNNKFFTMNKLYHLLN